MPYEKMYALLCGACSDAIDVLDGNDPCRARDLLQAALLEAEELYIQHAE